MGLLSMFSGSKPAKKPTDDVLLLLSMLLMSSADGYFDDAETETIEAFINQLPEFAGKNLEEVFAAAAKVAKKYSSTREAVSALGELSSPVLKKKAFVLAADLALSSGDVDEAEDAMLTSMQGVLGIDDLTAHKVLEVLSMKYAR